MKGKLLILWLVIFTSCVFAQTWVRHLEWEDLVPAWEQNPDANAYNVIPAVDGGYIMHGVVTIHNYVDEYTNVFWKVTQSGDVVWRNDQPTFDNTPMTCLVSNGIDKYYGLSSQYHRNILYTYDAQLNPINSIMVDTLLTSGEDIRLRLINVVDDGLLLSGRNRSNSIILKLDNNLELIWSRTYIDSSNYGGFYSVIVSQEGMITCSMPYEILWLASNGDILHVYPVVSPLSFVDYIIPQSDGSIVTRCGLETIQYGFAHFDTTGTFISAYSFTLPGSSGGLYSYYSNSADQQIIMLQERYDQYPVWQDYGILHKFSVTGENLWNSIFLSTTFNEQDIGHGKQPLLVDDQGYYILCLDPMTIIKADENGNVVSSNDPEIDAPEVAIAQAFPNPAMDRISFVLDNESKFKDLSIVVYNFRGQILHKIEVDEKSRIQSWGMPPELRNGVYLFRLKDGRNVIASGKFTIIK